MESTSVEQGVVPIVSSGKGFVTYRFVDGVNLNKPNIIAEAGKAANAPTQICDRTIIEANNQIHYTIEGKTNMTMRQAFWIHGTSVQVEREGYFISKQRAGFAAIFKTHGEEWFHFAIPTPVILNGKDTTLEKIFLFYMTKGTAKITNIHIHDAVKTIEAFKNLSLSGDHSTKVDKYNSWGISPVHVKFGLSISVHVDFGPATKLGVPEVRFASAGADFQTP